jgi:hypothetical protein
VCYGFKPIKLSFHLQLLASGLPVEHPPNPRGILVAERIKFLLTFGEALFGPKPEAFTQGIVPRTPPGSRVNASFCFQASANESLFFILRAILTAFFADCLTDLD